jgi:mRNA-degrading endonuclease RelE of RelBE toxin-antitoxin system
MVPSHRVAGSYRVHFSPEAWKIIGHMSSTTFQRLQQALERIADASRRTAAEATSPRQATLGDLTIVYELDDTKRSLTVLNILRADMSASG